MHLLELGATGAVAGAALGAATNMVNGSVSPLYFVNVLGWHTVKDVWRASIAQGVLEGLAFGIILSLIFTSVVGFVSKESCSYSVSVRYLLGILSAALVGWILGGLFAMGLATFSPEFYRNAFIGVPQGRVEMLKYAWVGGSIVGLQIGGFVGVITASLVFRGNWRRQT